MIGASDDALIIGGGLNDGQKRNALRVTVGGIVYSQGTYNTTGADYAEMFEWSDGNTLNEDRIGYFVTFDGNNKIRIANENDQYIIGVVSVNTAIVGDNYDDEWRKKYITDKWGRMQFEEVLVEAEYDDEGNIIIPEHIEEHPILNPDYNPTETYISRMDRQEWGCIGMLGKLLVYNDGTCEVGSMCKPNKDGIATKSTDGTGYYVMEIVEDLVMILFK